MAETSNTSPANNVVLHPPQLKLYANNGGRWAHRVLIALHEAGIPYEKEIIDLHNRPAYFLKEINPRGKVPVLVVDGKNIIIESERIVHFISELPGGKDAFGYTDPLQRAVGDSLVTQFLDLLVDDMFPIKGRVISPGQRQVYYEKQIAAIRTFQASIPSASGPYLFGKKITVADVLLAPFLGRFYSCGKYGIAPQGRLTYEQLQENNDFDRFSLWAESLFARESWKSTYDEDFFVGRQRKMVEDSLKKPAAAPRYPQYYPEPFDPNERFPEPESFDHDDRGKHADASFPNLLHTGVSHANLTPIVGTEIAGVQITDLNDRGKDELARLVAERGVLVFRDQDFIDASPDKQREWIKYFGPLYLHPSDRHPKDLPEYYSIYVDASDSSVNNSVNVIDNHLSSVTWHVDGAVEQQPPGLTLLFILETPESGGGDTLYSSMTEAYNRLSPQFQHMLEGLQAEHYLDYKPARRTPPRSVHPLVRTHPVTGKKLLFVNEVSTRRIVGLREEESDALLKLLFQHIAKGQDFACRVKWQPRSVIVWDNRTVQHSATTDFPSGQRRHLCRLTTIAEKPF